MLLHSTSFLHLRALILFFVESLRLSANSLYSFSILVSSLRRMLIRLSVGERGFLL